MLQPGSSHANRLLELVILVLELVDGFTRLLFCAWHRLTATAGTAKAGGSNPPPPSVVGVILAEPQTSDISMRTVASVATWCMAYSNVQQVHLYDPSGHLKRCQGMLEENLTALAAQEGRSVVIKCGWSVSRPQLPSGRQQQQQGNTGLQQQLPGSQHAAGWSAQQRTWSMWLAQQITGTQQQLGGPVQQQQQQKQAQQQQLMQAGTCNGVQGSRDQGLPPKGGVVADNKAGNLARSCPTDHQEAAAAAACNGPSSGSKPGVASSTAAAVTVRLLSAEDAYSPVIDVALERCSVFALPGGSPRASTGSKGQRQLLNSFFTSSSGNEDNDFINKTSNGVPGGSCRAAAAAAAQQDAAADQPCNKQQHVLGDSCSCGKMRCCQQPCNGVLPALCNGIGKDAAAAGVQQANSSSSQCSQHQQKQHQQQQQQDDAGPPGQLERTSQIRQPDQREQSNMQQLQKQQQQQGSLLPELAAVSSPDIQQEPQLLLVFGPVLTLAGYPPFHTRACEVQHLGSLAGASRQLIAAAVSGYCKVLQRHGA